jgi:UDP-2-acetamido-3-amino-2,3-dideoxy-glucuronate N-acetyltransferase
MSLHRQRPRSDIVDGAVFAHPHALIEKGAKLGSGSRVWAFAHVLKGAVVGKDCNLCDHILIEGKVRLGNRVTVKSGVFLWDGLIAEDDVFIGPAAVFVNDLRPRSRNTQWKCLQTLLQQGCSIGANATVLAGLQIGRFAMVGAGAVVTRDVTDFALVVGNPARFRSWVCRCGRTLTFRKSLSICDCGWQYRSRGNNKVEEVAS